MFWWILRAGVLLVMSAGSARATFGTYENVYGGELQSCSSDGMARTGFTRSGYCVNTNDDAGSHHICIDVSSASGGNFCDVTGQSDWCSSEMSCHDDENADCPVQQWCVCQWAFASYIDKAGGCNSIQSIVCEAINRQAVLAYQKQLSQAKYERALKCLIDKCGLSEALLE